MAPKITITATSTNVENPEAVFLAEYHGQRIRGNPACFVGMSKDGSSEVWTDGTYHQTEDHVFPPRNPSGSQNFGAIKMAARLACGYRVAECLKAFDEADRVARMMPTAGHSTGFMGTEAGSRIYTPLHFFAWWEAHLAGSAVATTWIRHLNTLVDYSTSMVGETHPKMRAGVQVGKIVIHRRVLWVGQRGGVPGSHIAGWIDAYAQWRLLDKPSSNIREAGKWGYPRDFELLDFHGRRIATDPAEDVPAHDYAMRTPWNILMDRKRGAVAAWVDGTVNGNTPPMMGAVVLANGSIQWLPHEGGQKRIRSANDQATCTFDPVGLALRYEAKLSRPSPMTVQIPGDGPYVWIRIEEDGTVTRREVRSGDGVTSALAKPTPPEPQPPAVAVPAGSEALRLTIDLRRSGDRWSASVVSQEPIP